MHHFCSEVPHCRSLREKKEKKKLMLPREEKKTAAPDEKSQGLGYTTRIVMHKDKWTFFFFSPDNFGVKETRHSETISSKKRYTLIPLYCSTRHFRRFWVKEPRHSENIPAKKRYNSCIPLYRSTRHFR